MHRDLSRLGMRDAQREYALHLARLARLNPSVDDSTPASLAFPHVQNKNKARAIRAGERADVTVAWVACVSEQCAGAPSCGVALIPSSVRAPLLVSSSSPHHACCYCLSATVRWPLAWEACVVSATPTCC